MRLATLLLFATLPLAADVHLPALFADHMVLQRDRPIHLWGTATPAERITVRLQNSSCAVTTDALGRWSCYLPSIPAGGPFDLTITAANTITLHDVLAGEVWVASGQSNMALQMSREQHLKEETPKARFPNIRFFNVASKSSETPLADVTGEWKLISPETLSTFSAVSYYFARDLHQKLNVPFGIIVSAVGGTPAEAWTSGLALSSDPLFLPALVRWQQTLAAYPDAYRRYEIQSKTPPKGATPPRPVAEPPGPGHRNMPSGLYNGMIAPLTPLAIRGVIWYQGENNAARDTSDQYTRLFETMIRDWRRAFAQGDFPFLYVQLPPWAPNNKPRELWPELQEAQLRTLELRNTGMVVTLDVGTLDNIHPPNKLDPGQRMALAARAIAYEENIEYSGPVFRQVTHDAGALRLWFDHAAGLQPHGARLEGFSIVGARGDYVPAEARVDGATIVVSSPQVRQPVAAHYAWGGGSTGNLYNAAGLPASPFRTRREE